ncbi:hypothetical protein [Pseudofrankia sp. DC12]|uniref:hypothetical protein n=1 Tax=Pseudofrankia sp. DC12 TaxID=683315 RepID=UPI0005F7CD85|nr:hypothetical protein [Pseudofrankia sp. DC12]
MRTAPLQLPSFATTCSPDSQAASLVGGPPGAVALPREQAGFVTCVEALDRTRFDERILA